MIFIVQEYDTWEVQPVEFIIKEGDEHSSGSGWMW